MNKILFSVITATILSSSMAAHSVPVDKYIRVSAEIPSALTIKKSNGKALNDIKLVKVENKNIHSHSENIQITINNGTGVNVKLGSPLELQEDRYAFELDPDQDPDLKKFTDHNVTIGGKALSLNNIKFTADEIKQPVDLVVEATEPLDVRGGEIYGGRLHLILEDTV
ncbi:CS1 type fimbrial major subunit [Yersinia hibernica]|uniref:Alpha-related fimbriae minor subunit 1 n=1 Tax=Yersinia enterocolitica LC20 TaxID=1443113 RepID=A0A7U4GIS0_YEREN|nr:CS1 type fimbrial major subunit [Yersinia hibernica]AHM76250.1 hypothetical protein LC20_04999 [Yersinia hibernica]OVZ94663.1 hypothetical protein CBW54_01085 [Yersinia kristensenii]